MNATIVVCLMVVVALVITVGIVLRRRNASAQAKR